MEFRVHSLMTFLAERLKERSNNFFNEVNFVTKEYDKVLLEYSKKSKPETYGGLADNRQNFGYVRFLFNRVEYNQEKEKYKGSKYNCDVSAHDNFQYYIDIEVKIVLIAWHIEHDILESWLRQTLFKISKEDSELFYKPPLKKTIELNPKSSTMNTYDVSLMELPKDKRTKEAQVHVIDGLTFYSMDVDVKYLWQHDICNEIDLCNIKC